MESGLEAHMEHVQGRISLLDHILRDLFTLLYIAGFCLCSLLYSALLWEYILIYPFYCRWTFGLYLGFGGHPLYISFGYHNWCLFIEAYGHVSY